MVIFGFCLGSISRLRSFPISRRFLDHYNETRFVNDTTAKRFKMTLALNRENVIVPEICPGIHHMLR